MNLELLIRSLKEAPIVKKGDYQYVIHPITDGIPQISPALLNEVTIAFKEKITPYLPFDRIVTMEAMGIPLATSLSTELNKPFTIIRKRSYGLSDEHPVKQQTGYSEATLFINGLHKNDSVIIVDDVLSTGGTLKAVLHTLDDMGVIVKAVFVAVNKGISADNISKETGKPIESLVRISISQNKVHIDESCVFG